MNDIRRMESWISDIWRTRSFTDSLSFDAEQDLQCDCRALSIAKSTFAKAHANVESMKVDWKPSLEKDLDELKQQERQLHAQYNQACALYVDSNIHARRQSIKGDHPAFESPDFVMTDVDFLSPAPSDDSNKWDISKLETVGSNQK